MWSSSTALEITSEAKADLARLARAGKTAHRVAGADSPRRGCGQVEQRAGEGTQNIPPDGH
ncbi:MAG: hypothetical protein ACREDA_13100 [Methylocella sp.]